MEKKQSFLKKATVFFLLTILFISCGKKEKALLKVQIRGLAKEQAVIEEQRISGVKILDTLVFNSNGKFRYKLHPHQPTFYNLHIPHSSDIFFIISPGDKVSVKGRNEGKIANLEIQGSDESVKLNNLYDSLFAVRKILKGLRNKYNNSEDQVLRDSLTKEYTGILNGYRKFSMQFVLDNLQSLCSIAALYQEVGPSEFVFGRRRDLQFFKLVTDSLNKYYPRHRHVQAVTRNFSTMIQSVQLEKLLSKADEINKGLPELELPDINGKIRRLDDIKQRYVLLNFFNESDPSIAANFPLLKKIHEQYSGKNFEIFNVYIGKSAESWKRIVYFEEINKWINVADTSFPYSDTRAAYNIQSLPTNFFIDMKEKAILLRDVNPSKLNSILPNLQAEK